MARKCVVWMILSFVIFIFFPITPAYSSNADNGGIPTSDDVLQIATPMANAPTETGAAIQNIPISLPPGRAGIEPKLSLAYSSRAGNGWLGVGWDLNLGSIERSTKYGLSYGTEWARGSDKYILSGPKGKMELVQRVDWGTDCYGAKIEGSFSRYCCQSNNQGWIVKNKDGMTYYYGTSANSQVNTRYGTFKWLLDKISDTVGNTIKIEYVLKEDLQTYPYRIHYTSNNDITATNHVIFNLEPRPDTISSYSSRSKINTMYRLKSIDIYNDIVNTTTPFASYNLQYSQSTSTRRSLLTNVTRSAFNFTTQQWESLPSIVLSWTQRSAEFDNNRTWKIGPPASSSLSSLEFVDLNGDHKADIFCSWSWQPIGSPFPLFYWNEYTNDGSNPVSVADGQPPLPLGEWADLDLDGTMDWVEDREWNDHNTLVMLHPKSGGYSGNWQKWGRSRTNEYEYSGYGWVDANQQGFRLADVTGDGLPDYIYEGYADVGGGRAFRVRQNAGTSFDNDSEWGFRTAGYYPLNDGIDQNPSPFVMVDLNGDGLADILYEDKDNQYHVLLSTGSGFSGDKVWGYRTRGYATGQQPFTLADVNGDGLPDIVYIASGTTNNVRVLLNTGVGFTDETLHPYTASAPKIRGTIRAVVDIDNDGLADFIYLGTDNYVHVIKSTGIGFADDVRIRAYSSARMLNVADMNADGLFDIILLDSEITLINGKACSGGTTPDLLLKIENGYGGSSTINYSPSSAYQNTYLPYVIPVVSSITIDDGNPLDGNSSPYTTRYFYSGGLHSAVDREFRGFSLVSQTLPDGTIVESTYDQSDISKGLLLQQVTKRESAVTPGAFDLYDVLKNTYTPVLVGTGQNGEQVYFPSLSVRDDYEYYGSLCYQTETTFEYDSYGNVTGKYFKDKNRSFDDGRYEHTDYYYDTSRWIVSLPVYTYVSTSATGAKAAENTFSYYDGTNRLREKSSIVVTDRDVDRPLTDYVYDSYGNLQTATDVFGVKQVDYDDETHTYPALTTNAVGLQVRTDYNAGFGKLEKEEDANHNVTNYTFDAFGRPTSVSITPSGGAPYLVSYRLYHRYVIDSGRYIQDDNGQGYPNFAHFWMVEQREYPGRPDPGSWQSAGYIWKKIYLDGLGRQIRTESEGSEDKVILTQTVYNNRGKVQIQYVPHYSDSPPSEIKFTGYEYDCLGREIKATHPDGTISTKQYFQKIAEVTVSGGHAYEIRPASRTTVSIDANGHKREEDYDGFGRLRGIEEYTGNSASCASGGAECETYKLYAGTRYSYDVLGNLTQVTPPSVTTSDGTKVPIPPTSISYDTLGRKTRIQDPDTGTWSYTRYDAHGNLLSQADGAGKNTTYSYDALDRIVQKLYGDGAYTRYVYDDPAHSNSQGRLSSVIEYGSKNAPGNPVQSVVSDYSYDEAGRIAMATKL